MTHRAGGLERLRNRRRALQRTIERLGTRATRLEAEAHLQRTRAAAARVELAQVLDAIAERQPTAPPP